MKSRARNDGGRKGEEERSREVHPERREPEEVGGWAEEAEKVEAV